MTEQLWHNGKKIVYVVVSVLSLYSCYSDSNFVIPPHHPSLVVHAYVETGQFFKLAVSKTSSSTGPVSTDYYNYVRNAEVILFQNDIAKDTVHYDNGEERYTSTRVMAIAGNTYKVIIKAPGFTSVEATAIAPVAINTDFVSITRDARADANNQLLDDIIFRFHDPAGEHNYYRVELNRPFPGGLTTSPFCVYTYDPAVEQYQSEVDPFTGSNCIWNDEVLLSDRSFNGTVKEITISGIAYDLQEYTDVTGTYRPYLKKYNISEDYYKYIKSVISLDAIKDNPFVQPFTIKGNVKNGYGLFTIFSATTDTLR